MLHTHTYIYIYILHCVGARGRAFGYGTTLQVGRSRVSFPMVSLEVFVDVILPAALWPWRCETIRRSDRSSTLVWLDDSIERLVFCLCLLLVGRVHLQIPFLLSLFLIWQSLMIGSVTSRSVRRAWFVSTSSGGPGVRTHVCVDRNFEERDCRA
jgi:hypothetical protein